MIMTLGATATMLNQYCKIVIKLARKVDAGSINIEMKEILERGKMHKQL